MDETPAAAPDPAERWRYLSAPPRAEDWITEHDVDPVPGSISNRWSLVDSPVLYGDDGDGDDRSHRPPAIDHRQRAVSRSTATTSSESVPAGT